MKLYTMCRTVLSTWLVYWYDLLDEGIYIALIYCLFCFQSLLCEEIGDYEQQNFYSFHFNQNEQAKSAAMLTLKYPFL